MPVTRWIPRRHVKLPVIQGRMILSHYLNSPGTFLNVTRWRTHPLHHGYRSPGRTNRAWGWGARAPPIFCSPFLNFIQFSIVSVVYPTRVEMLPTHNIVASFSSLHNAQKSKSLRKFSPVSRWIACKQVTIFVTMAGRILFSKWKPLEHSWRVLGEAHALHIKSIIFAIAHTCTGYRLFTLTRYRSFAKYELLLKHSRKFITR